MGTKIKVALDTMAFKFNLKACMNRLEILDLRTESYLRKLAQ